MRVFDKGSSQQLLFDGIWQRPAAIATPSGGAVVNTEARATLAALLAALVTAGVLAA